jgi:hypothetical protein
LLIFSGSSEFPAENRSPPTMTDKDNAVIEALGRINRFAIPRLAAFPVGSIALTDFARASSIAGELPTSSMISIQISPPSLARSRTKPTTISMTSATPPTTAASSNACFGVPNHRH